MNKLDFTEAINIIDKSDRIFIASHINPDGDNLGSMLALYFALKKYGKEVYPLKSDILPRDFLFLDGIDRVIEYDDSLEEIDLLILVDSSDEDRLGKNKDLLKKAKFSLNIDHHLSNSRFGDINIIDPKAAATGEMIYQLIKSMNISIDKKIASNLYVAIVTDTGKFTYDSVTSKTHRIIADLLDTGIDSNEININLYENRSIEKTQLMIKSLSTLKFYNNYSVGLVKVSQKMLKETNSKIEDTNGIVEVIRGIRDVEVAAILKEEKKNKIKVSLRSKKVVDVSKICKKFSGGGHVRAAGCTINSSLNEAEKLLIEEINNTGD